MLYVKKGIVYQCTPGNNVSLVQRTKVVWCYKREQKIYTKISCLAREGGRVQKTTSLWTCMAEKTTSYSLGCSPDTIPKSTACVSYVSCDRSDIPKQTHLVVIGQKKCVKRPLIFVTGFRKGTAYNRMCCCQKETTSTRCCMFSHQLVIAIVAAFAQNVRRHKRAASCLSQRLKIAARNARETANNNDKMHHWEKRSGEAFYRHA